MDINDLNKNQLILIALLLSFVTSIATGIVTVSLMEQAPPGVTQTINRVVERTVQVIEPQQETQVITEQIVVREGDLISQAIEKHSPSYVALFVESQNGVRAEIASGFVVRDTGLVATTDSVISSYNVGDVYALYKDAVFKTRLVAFNQEAYLAIIELAEIQAGQEDISAPEFTAADMSAGQNLSLGRTVIAVDTTHDTRIGAGMITRLERSVGEGDEGSEALSYIHTSITMASSLDGGPLVLADGTIIGVSFVSRDGLVLASPAHVVEKMLTDIEVDGVDVSASQSALQIASALSSIQNSENETQNNENSTVDVSSE